MDTPKPGVELALELAAKSAKMKYRENPTFLEKLDFGVFGVFQTFQMILRCKNPLSCLEQNRDTVWGARI